MSEKTTKMIFNNILPFIIIGIHILTLVLCMFDIDEFIYEPFPTVVCWILCLVISFLIFRYRNIEEKSLMHYVTALLLLIYFIVSLVNEENLGYSNTLGAIAYFSTLLVVPGLTLCYLMIYAFFKMGWLQFNKGLTALITLITYLVVLFGVFAIVQTTEFEVDFGISDDNAHRCITCGEVKYISEQTNGYWICNSCKNK